MKYQEHNATECYSTEIYDFAIIKDILCTFCVHIVVFAIMSLIVLYFLHSTSVLSFYIDVVLTLSISMVQY